MLEQDTVAALLALVDSDPALPSLPLLQSIVQFGMEPEARESLGSKVLSRLDVPPGTADRPTYLRAIAALKLPQADHRLSQLAVDFSDPDSYLAAKLLQSKDETLAGLVGLHVPLLTQLAADGTNVDALRELAWLPPERYDIDLSTFASALASDDLEVRLWASIAVAKRGDHGPLLAVLADLADDAPGWMWGNPWTPYDVLSRARPVPEALRLALLQVEDVDLGREQQLLVWALTGAKTATGQEIHPTTAVRPVIAATQAEARSLRAAVRAAVAAVTVSLLPRDALAQADLMEPEQQAEVVTELVHATIEVQQPGESDLWGNATMDALGAATRIPLDVERIVTSFVQSERPGIDVRQLGAVLGRADDDTVVRCLTTALREAPAVRIDDLVRLLEESSRGDVVYLGAGPGSPDSGAFAYPDTPPAPAPPQPAPAWGGSYTGPVPAAPSYPPAVTEAPGPAAFPPPSPPPAYGAPPGGYGPPPGAAPPKSGGWLRLPSWGFRRKRSQGKEPLPPIVGPPMDQQRLKSVEVVYTAYPRISTDDDVVVLGQTFDVTIGLAGAPGYGVAYAGPIVVKEAFPIEDLEVELVVDPLSVEVVENQRVFPLRVTGFEDFPSHVVQLRALYAPGLNQDRRIALLYRRRGRVVGFAFRLVRAVENEAARRRAQGPAPVKESVLDLAPLVDDGPPDLLLCLFRGDLPDSYVWGVYPRSGPVPDLERSGTVKGAKDFATYLGRALRSKDLKGLPAYDQLVGYGSVIDDTMPQVVTDALKSTIASAGDQAPTVLLLTQEPFVPWELAVPSPRPATAFGGESPFLGAHVAFSRWPLSETRKPELTRVPAITVRSQAAVTADYTGVKPWAPLVHARSEVRQLVGTYGMTEVSATRAALRACFTGETAYDVIHVALHGQKNPEGIEDGLVLVEPDAAGNPTAAFYNATQVIGLENIATRPFVFLNACQVGSADEVLGSYVGLATDLLRTRASAVVGPLWNVDDSVAAAITAKFYAAAYADPPVPVAEILRRVRAEYTLPGVTADPETCTPTLVAFQCYGHPHFVLQRTKA